MARYWSGQGGTLQIVSQTLTVSVTVAGTGYTSVPNVAFSGGGGSGAVPIATLSGTTVGSIAVFGNPVNYATTPTVTISPISGGPGSGATADATLVTTTTTLPNFTYEVEPKARIWEATNAASGGVAEWGAGVTEHSGNGEVMWDSSVIPERVGLVIGQQIKITANMGNSSKTYVIIGFVESGPKPKVDARNGGITYSFGWRGTGSFTPPTNGVP